MVLPKQNDPTPPDAPVASSPAHAPQALAPGVSGVEASSAPLPRGLSFDFRLTRDQHDRAAILVDGPGNPYVVPIDSKEGANLIRRAAKAQGKALRSTDVKEVQEILRDHATEAPAPTSVYYRVAPVKNGIEIDLGDDAHRRIRITPGEVRILKGGSRVLFYRSPVMRPFVRPAKRSDLQRLAKYVNLDPLALLLLIAWLS